MKPTRNTVLIERINHISHKTTESGLFIVDQEKDFENFSEFEESMADVVFKKPFEKNDLTSKLIEHSKKKHGLIDTLRGEGSKVYDEKVKNIINRNRKNYGRIVELSSNTNYYEVGDLVYFRGQSEIMDFTKDGKEYLLVAEKHVLVKECDDKLIPHPDFVLVKISKESRESLFRKRIIRDDGTPAMLFITVDDDKLNDRKSEIFVSGGQVLSVGKNVSNILPDDTAIIHYLIDNNDDLIVGYDGPDKLVVVDAITTRHQDDNIINESRKNRKQAAWLKGDYDNLSSLIGVVREDKIYPRDPFVMLEHKSNVIGRVTRSGLIYHETEVVLEREVLSISKESIENYDIVPGMRVLVNDFDVFSVMIDGKRLSCVNDQDIMAKVD